MRITTRTPYPASRLPDDWRAWLGELVGLDLRGGPAPRSRRRPGLQRTRPAPGTRTRPVSETATRGRGHLDLRGMGAPAGASRTRARTRTAAPSWRLTDPTRTTSRRPVRVATGPATWRL